MKLIFDIEADSLYPTRVWCLVIQDLDGKVFSFVEEDIKEGIKLLESAEEIIGHNILSFDVPVLKRLYNFKPPKIFDTLVASRLIYTNLMEDDARAQDIPSKYYGKHSLAAWGARLGSNKGEFNDWSKFSQEMLHYCKQDVNINAILYIKVKDYSPRALEIEHRFREIINIQEKNGVPFDVIKARALSERIDNEIKEIADKIADIIPCTIKPGKEFTPKKSDNKGRRAGATYCKLTIEKFNPTSRTQILRHLASTYDFKPERTTSKGNDKIDHETLRKLPYAECQLFADMFERAKIQGFVSKGKNAWLKLQRNGRIYGSVNTNGAVTGRCTHANPNLGQVPSIRSYLGKECRELFHSGYYGWMVGADASGLELRCLAHYLAAYDGGAYAKTILEGDIHTENQKAAGLETRDLAKTFIYAFAYGAGDEKLGSIATGKHDPIDNKKIGKALRESFLSKTEGLRQFTSDVKIAAEKRGHLVGLDGRLLHVRSGHKALNTLLQSAGAVLMKQANIHFWEHEWPNTLQVLNIHDEAQLIHICSKEKAEEVGKGFVDAITKAGETFNLRIRLDGEYKVGRDWASTH